jgi:glutamate synthase domain-containing protein 1
MCRLAAITSSEYVSPMECITSLETMKEGHDGSGLGLVFKDLGGEFENLKEYPILSGICSKKGMEVLDEYMERLGFKVKFMWEPKIKNPGPRSEIRKRDHYIAKAYKYPEEYQDKSEDEKEELRVKVRLDLRRMGENDESIFVFSFYPDILTLKEVGDPLELGDFFGLDDDSLKAKIIFAQGRQNTNYAIYLYACHPFFLQGYCTMTNGENTAFVPIKEYLMSRGNPSYMGYDSDSEVFVHILHYACRVLGYPLSYYKDIITPLKDKEIDSRKDAEAVRLIKKALRPLCIDGPNCVIGFAPDGTVFMVQDAKKLRPGIVGGKKGKFGFVSETCGLDKLVPDRNKSLDVFPMKYDMVMVTPNAEEVRLWNQLHG